MKTTRPERLELPENCAVRLIDLDVSVGGLIAVDEAGFVNIYLNARLSRDAQMKALRHELRHYYRGDLYSDADIREVERLADGPVVLDLRGAPVEAPAVFDPEAVRTVGRGLYRPTGQNLARATADLMRVKALLREACAIFDVMRGSPAARLLALAEGLTERDIAFLAWQPPDAPLPVALRFYREDGDKLHGALYYAPDGALDDALAAFELDDVRVTVDLRTRGGKLAVCGIGLEADGVMERVY